MPLAWIVDDDEEMSHAVQLMLRMLEYEVETYKDARIAARKLAAGIGPDLIILISTCPRSPVSTCWSTSGGRVATQPCRW
jgi:DNA-binding response OmpR family regulator